VAAHERSASGGSFIIFLAGLQGIATLLYEAADIDGATWWTVCAVALPRTQRPVLGTIPEDD
jgi:ABC-type sugar transport system permease subunit